MRNKQTGRFAPARVTCDQCQMLAINGYACHETGCPNSGAKWENCEWIKYYDCRQCGFPVRAGEACDCQIEEKL